MFTDKLKFFYLVIGIALIVFIEKTVPITLGLDLQGGMLLVLEAQDTPQVKVNDDAVLGAMAIIQNRINGLGVSEPVIQRKGKRQISVELPGISDPSRAEKLIGDTALLEFVEAEFAPADAATLNTEDIKIIAGEGMRLSRMSLKDNDGNVVQETPIFLGKTVMTGNDLSFAGPSVDQFGKPIINIEFTAEGTRKFADVTRLNVGKPLAILLDGVVISAPRINGPIPGGKAQISGAFSINEVQDMVIKLKAGSLPVPVIIIEKKEIGPTLGKTSIDKSIKAGIVGFILVALFMIINYKYLGFVSIVSLFFYFFLNMSIFRILHVTLTLPGLAGIILSMGMAVDTNVLIFERYKEEFRDGKSVRNALESGYKRAMATIIDSHLTTLITAFVLFWFGTGTIKGFAVTLAIGIFLSLFTALVLSNFFLFASLNITKIRESRLIRFK
ncbi:MAG: protein translocase subunit SecD [Candidatus Riflemargulisbacteria bacterium]